MSSSNSASTSSAERHHGIIDDSRISRHKAAGHSGLVNALEDKLQTLVGTSSGYIIESLPPKIKKRVEALQKMQAQHDELESKYLEEKAALEAKYQNMYETLYNKRYDIVNGITDVEDAEEEKTGQDVNQETTSEDKGIPEFWSYALTSNDFLCSQITERDEDALKFLKDIKWSRLDEGKGFKLDFYFNENPYFKNPVLTKTYYLVDEYEPILDRATGTEIDWFPGKSLREKVMKRRGGKNGKAVKRIEQSPTFFNFFHALQIPQGVEGLDEDFVDDLQDLMDNDLDIGLTMRDKIIPCAVSWFTGEAIETDDEDEDEDEDEGVDGNEDDDEDEDEDDEDKENDEEEDDHEEKDHGHQKRGVKDKPKRASN